MKQVFYALSAIALGTVYTAWSAGALTGDSKPVFSSGTGTVVSGQATVIDGDTLRVGDVRIRLWGIDAPENSQICDHGPITSGVPYPCGKEATSFMQSLLAGDENVSCDVRDHDRYSRTVAVCRNKTGDLGARMVRAGWALDYWKYSNHAYAKEEAEAITLKRGLWAGTFDLPWNYRHDRAHR